MLCRGQEAGGSSGSSPAGQQSLSHPSQSLHDVGGFISSSAEEMYRAIVSSYEERQKVWELTRVLNFVCPERCPVLLCLQAMLVENGSLRESLSVMQREFVSLLNEQQQSRRHKKPLTGRGGGGGGGEREGGDREDYGALSSGHFQMPYDLVRDGEYYIIQGW